jgi:hypothetical protein
MLRYGDETAVSGMRKYVPSKALAGVISWVN